LFLGSWNLLHRRCLHNGKIVLDLIHSGAQGSELIILAKAASRVCERNWFQKLDIQRCFVVQCELWPTARSSQHLIDRCRRKEQSNEIAVSVAAPEHHFIFDSMAAALNNLGNDWIFTKIGSENRRKSNSQTRLSVDTSCFLRFDNSAKDFGTACKQRRPIREEPKVGTDSEERRA